MENLDFPIPRNIIKLKRTTPEQPCPKCPEGHKGLWKHDIDTDNYESLFKKDE
jgi:hypothetical protein